MCGYGFTFGLALRQKIDVQVTGVLDLEFLNPDSWLCICSNPPLWKKTTFKKKKTWKRWSRNPTFGFVHVELATPLATWFFFLLCATVHFCFYPLWKISRNLFMLLFWSKTVKKLRTKLRGRGRCVPSVSLCEFVWCAVLGCEFSSVATSKSNPKCQIWITRIMKRLLPYFMVPRVNPTCFHPLRTRPRGLACSTLLPLCKACQTIPLKIWLLQRRPPLR